MDDVARAGAQQPQRFKPASAARLDDPARFAYLPPQEIAPLLAVASAANLLDFGAGTGTYAVEFARAYPRLPIYALDEQPEMLDRLRAKIAAAGCTNVVPIGPGDVAALRGTIDRIFALNVLHELGDAALAEMHGLLRRDGTALVIDWNADVARPHGPPADHVYGPDAARKRLEAHGFTVLQSHAFRYHYALTCAANAGRARAGGTS